MLYDVTVQRLGTITVEADSEEEALLIDAPASEIDWDSNYVVKCADVSIHDPSFDEAALVSGDRDDIGTENN